MSHEGGGVRLPHVHELPAPSGAARPQLRGLTLCPVAARWGAAAWLGYPFAVCDPDLRGRSSVIHLAHSSLLRISCTRQLAGGGGGEEAPR